MVLEGQDISGLLREEARDLIVEWAIKEQRLPQEPRLDKKSGAIMPERDGVVIDVPETLEAVMHARTNQQIHLTRKSIHAQYSSGDLEKLRTHMGAYHTFVYGSYQRHTNISLAAAAINNSVVWPQEEFSFNEIVGPRTPERGYMPAPVILQGASNFDYGGGVCQVSSTVYNAALAAGLPIIERHPHSRPVRYVPFNRDATVNFGYLDLRIRNDTNSPIIIKSGVDQGKVWVSILGEGSTE